MGVDKGRVSVERGEMEEGIQRDDEIRKGE